MTIKKSVLVFLLLLAATNTARAGTVDEEDYWKLVRSCFYLTEDGIYMNTGTSGLQTMQTINAVIEQNVFYAKNFFPQANPSADLKKKLAAFVGALPEEIAILRNTTEAMNAAAASFSLKPGDEILTTAMEHVGGMSMWEMKAEREKLKLTRIDLPFLPKSRQELLDAFQRAINKKTKVISFSSITFTNGMVLPVKEICEYAHFRGILTVIDGAHSPGLTDLNLDNLGCDFFASSLHKWLLAPKGVGMLYVRKGLFAEKKLYPLIASGGWDKRENFSAIFETLGTINLGLLTGLEKSIDFFNIIGKQRIVSRLRELNDYMYVRLKKIPGIEMFTPADPDLRAGMVAFKIRHIGHSDIAKKLWDMGKIQVRLVSEYNYNLVRLSAHIYTSKAEIDTVCDCLAKISAEAGN